MHDGRTLIVRPDGRVLEEITAAEIDGRWREVNENLSSAESESYVFRLG
jgi:hypothetical protein